MTTTDAHSPSRSTGTLPTYMASDESLPTYVAAEGSEGLLALTRISSRSRNRRSPARLPLRTAFRNFSAVATVVVGDEKSKARPETTFLVHKELLTSASPFFAAALNSTFAEGLDQTVRLPEEKPEVFEWFLQWLYTGTLMSPSTNRNRVSRNMDTSSSTFTTSPSIAARPPLLDLLDMQIDGDLRNHAGSPKYFLLLDIYALSDRLLTTPLSNHILSTIARLSESTNSVPTPSDTFILYDHVRDSAPLRTLILDLFAYKKTDKLLESHKDEWHPKFLRELVVKLKRPGPEAIERHSLVAWRPGSWATSKGCEGCKEVLQPGVSGDRCLACEKVFCATCRRKQMDATGSALAMDPSGCKPWMAHGMCDRYHEHHDGEACA